MSESTKNKVVVKICGTEYTLVGNESYDHMHKIASYIDKKMTELSETNRMLSTSMLAVLTAINVADELFKEISSKENLYDELKSIKKQLELIKLNNFKQNEEIKNLKLELSDLELELAKKEAELEAKEKELERIMYRENNKNIFVNSEKYETSRDNHSSEQTEWNNTKKNLNKISNIK